jgi:hypothetical protein
MAKLHGIETRKSTTNILQLCLIYAIERHKAKPVARIQASAFFKRKIEELKTEG